MRQKLNASTPTRLATTAPIILLAAAAATFLVDKTEANPNPATPEVTSHPCEGLQSSLFHLTHQTLTRGGETTRISQSASGGCRLNVTVSSESMPSARDCSHGALRPRRTRHTRACRGYLAVSSTSVRSQHGEIAATSAAMTEFWVRNWLM